jgi:hypothetical protein
MYRGEFLYRATLVFALSLVCYTANGRTPGWGDTVSTRYLPISILRERNFDLDEFPQMYDVVGNYWAKQVRGAWVSFYPVGAAIAATPLYAPAIVAGTLSAADGDACRRMEKVAAAVIVALSAAFLDAALVRQTSLTLATAITVAYALGTSSLSVSSQALWQHGPSQLCFAITIVLLLAARDDKPALAAIAGLPLAFAVVCRPTNAVVFLPLALYVVVAHRRATLGFALAAAVPFAFQLAYNVAYFGTPLWLQFSFSDRKLWRGGRPLDFLSGLLFSPSRGLFFYSPVLLFGVAGLGLAWRRGGDPLLRAVAVGFILALSLHARWWMWWGGGSYGPRLTADLTPLLAFAIVACADALRVSRVLRAVFGVTIVWSVFAHAVGGYWDDGRWNERIQGTNPSFGYLWSWTDNQLVNAPGDMLRAAADQLHLRTLPLDAEAAALLRERGEGDTRRDHYWTELAELYRAAGDEREAASVEGIRRARFTPREALDWRIEDELTLLGVDRELESPNVLRLTYYWRAERWIADDEAIVTRFTGDGCEGKSEFLMGSPDATTKTWNPGETFKVIDRLQLPFDFPKQGCSLELEVWAPDSGRKLCIRRWPVWQRRATFLRVLPSPQGFTVASAFTP